MIKIKNMTKKYGEKVIFRDLSLDIEEGKTTVILGNSGIGKTTLLNVVTGVDTEFQGEIEGIPETISYCFQEARLLEWKSVRENIEFVLPKGRVDREKIDDIMKKMEIFDIGDKKVTEISGGQMQRCAIARAVLFPSEIIFLDEPFKSMDLALRYGIIRDFEEGMREDKRSVVLVTHNIDEALILGDVIHIFGGVPAEIKKSIKIDIEKGKRSLDSEELMAFEKEIYGVIL